MGPRAPRLRRHSKPSRPRRVVWTVLEDLGFLAILEPRALSLARQHFVIKSANTWPEAKAILTPGEYRELQEFKSGDEDGRTSGYHTFEPPAAFFDGLWPGWPAQDALKWVPEELVTRFADVQMSWHDGPFLQWEAPADEIVASLEVSEFELRRDDGLCRLAAGYADSSAEIDRKRSAFWNTDYEVQLPERLVILQPGKSSPAIAKYLQERGHASGVVITGYNPCAVQQSQAKNETANKRLRAELRRAKATALPAQGSARDGLWPAEPSWFASGITPMAAMRIAKAFGQDAVLFCSADGEVSIWWARFPIDPVST